MMLLRRGLAAGIWCLWTAVAWCSVLEPIRVGLGPDVEYDALIQPVTNSDDGASFDLASQLCEGLGGHLLSIHNYDTTMAVARAVSVHSYPLWLGLSAPDDDIEPSWSDNSTLDFQLWSPRSQGAGSSRYCVQMDVTTHSGTWEKSTFCDGNPSRDHGYVCSVPKATAPGPPEPYECPASYELYDGSCYRYIPAAQPYSAAQQTCQGESAQLVSIHSDAENAAVLRHSGGQGHVMMGFSRVGVDGSQFAWDDGSYVQKTRWADREPVEGRHCAGVNTTDTRWYARDCDEPGPFVCKIYKDEALLPEPDRAGECPDQEHRLWGSHGDFCYYFSQQRATWRTARERCLALGALLTPIHHPDTNDFLRQAITVTGSHWIGYYRKDGKWQWEVPDVRPYSNWKFGEPKSDEDYNVAALEITSSESPEWVSDNGIRENYFICRSELGAVSTEPPLMKGFCPDEAWVQRGNVCYLFQPDMPVTWSEGQRQCHVWGGMHAHLVVIPDLATNRYIQYMLSHSSGLPLDRGHWIGLSNQTLESGKPVWQWENGRVLGVIDWDNWMPIDQQRKNDCVVMRTSDGYWWQQECPGFRGFACQVQVGTGYFEEIKPAKQLSHQENSAIAISVAVICLLALALVALFLYQRNQRALQLPDNESSVAYTHHQTHEGDVDLFISKN